MSTAASRIILSVAGFVEFSADLLELCHEWDYQSADEARERMEAAYKRIDAIIRRAADKAANAALNPPKPAEPKTRPYSEVWGEGGVA